MHADTAILLLNLGGPVTLAHVRPFLRELFSDRDLIRMPVPAFFQPFVASLIARFRAGEARARYAEIGGGSPLLKESAIQAAALREQLRSAGFAGPVKLVFRVAQPRAARVLANLKRQGVTKLLPVSLYPHACRATTGSSIRELARESQRLGLRLLEGVHDYATDPYYLDAVDDPIRDALSELPGATVIFSAHGLPLKQIAAGDPYQWEIEATVAALQEREKDLAGGFRLAYQSRVGPIRWLEPDLRDVLAECAGKDVVVVPISFVTEHIETLHELDIQYAAIARQCGVRTYRRVRTVGADPRFIRCLFRRAMTALEQSP